MKKILISSILIVALASGVAFARGGGYGRNSQGNYGCQGYGMQGLGPGGQGYGMMGPGYGKRGPGMMGGGYGMRGTRGGFGGPFQWTDTERQQFLDATKDLRKELHAKRFEYMEASRGTNTDNNTLASIEKEMIDLRTKIQNKGEEIKAAKVTTQ
jgi:hypothetical protein